LTEGKQDRIETETDGGRRPTTLNAASKLSSLSHRDKF